MAIGAEAVLPMPIRSVLLVKPGSMGDVIHALPVASAIRQKWPDARLTWVIDPRWAPLLEGNPAVSSALLFPRESFRGASGWMRAAGWFGRLRQLRPGVAVDLQGLLRSALMSLCSGARVICGLGDAREGARFFYHRTAEVHPPEHSVKRYLRALPLIGIEVPAAPEFPLPAGDRAGVPDDYIVLHPFARGEGKSMGDAEIRAFAGEFRERSKLPVVILGSGAQPADLPAGTLDLAGKTSLLELVGILRGARFVVSVDSGPMHLAAALGRPLLGIHTWSDPRTVGPATENAWIWQGGEIRRQEFSRAPMPEAPFTAEAAREAARFVARQSA